MKSIHKLNELFEAWGHWWLPETPETQFNGILSYAPSAITLRLFGSFHEPSLQENMTVGGGDVRFPALHGRGIDGKRYTLFNVMKTKTHGPLFGAATNSEWSAIYLLVGDNTQPRDSLLIHSMSVQYRNFAAFVNRQVFSLTPPITNANCAITYTHPETIVARVDSIETTFEIDSNVSWLDNDSSVTIGADACAEIKPDQPQLLEWYINVIWRLCDLLALLTDEPTSPTEIRLRLKDDDYIDGWLLYQAVTPAVEENRPAGVLLFYLGHIIKSFAEVLERWFSASQILVSATYLFRNAQRINGYSSAKFLDATKSLEAFSRSRTDSTYLATNTFDEVKSALLAAIPKSVGCDFHRSLERRIHFANEYSFRKRLNDLIKSLSSDAADIVYKRRSDFIDGIVATRNYFTHYSDDPDTKPLAAVSQSWACEKMLLLLRILLLRDVGIAEDEVVTRIKNHNRLGQYIVLWKKHPECVPRSKIRQSKTSASEKA